MSPAPKQSSSGISSGFIKHLLVKRCETNAKASKSKLTTRLRKRAPVKSVTAEVAAAPKRRFRRKRRYRRRRAAAVAPLPRTTKPGFHHLIKKKTVEIAVQTSFDSVADGPLNVSVGTSAGTSGEVTSRERKPSIKPVKKEKKEEKWEGFVEAPALEGSTKKRTKKERIVFADVITLSDDEVQTSEQKGNGVAKSSTTAVRRNDGALPSSSNGRSAPKKHPSRMMMLQYDDPDDSDYEPREQGESVLMKRLRERRRDVTVTPKVAVVSRSESAAWATGSDRVITSNVTVADLLFMTPVAQAIAKSLPMKSLASLARVNPELREICDRERCSRRRQRCDWIYRPGIITTLDSYVVLTEEAVFGTSISDLYCEPEVVIAFCTPRIMYDYRLDFCSPRSKITGEFKDLNTVLTDSMPKYVQRVLHVRTYGVMPPVPPKVHGNPRKVDYYGCRESPRDLCVLTIPKIFGVNIWRESLTDEELRRQLKNSGWLENRSQNHFLLPIIKDLEPLEPKLVIMFSRRLANHDRVVSADFPVLVLNTMDDLDGSSFNGGTDYGLEYLVFGGLHVTAYQAVLKGGAGRTERMVVLRQLRDQFTAQQVMSGRMIVLYFRNVNRLEGASDELGKMFEGDMKQLREEFPTVPVFGGGYQNVIGSVFTKEKIGDFGKFFTGVHLSFVCAIVLGN